MEEINTVSIVEYDHYGGGDIVVEEIGGLPKPLTRRGFRSLNIVKFFQPRRGDISVVSVKWGEMK
jgi:hypothetical protein